MKLLNAFLNIIFDNLQPLATPNLTEVVLERLTGQPQRTLYKTCPYSLDVHFLF